MSRLFATGVVGRASAWYMSHVRLRFLLTFMLMAGLLLPVLPAEAVTYTVHSDREGTTFRYFARNPRLTGKVGLADGVRYDVLVDQAARYALKRVIPRGPVREVVIAQRGKKVSVTLRWRFSVAAHPRFTRGRMELYWPHELGRTTTNRLADGVTLSRTHRFTSAGPQVIHVLRASLEKASLIPKLAVGDGDGFGLEPVGSIARRSKALAAINGSFFSPKGGEPIGLLVLDGQIISSSYFNRSVFGIRHDGTCFIDNAKLLAAVRMGREDKVFIANGVNQHAARDKIVLYTHHFGQRTRTVADPSRREFAIAEDGTVLAAATGNMEIPERGYVLSGQGQAIWNLKKYIRVGDRAEVYTELNGLWRGVKYAVGGGPTLVARGNVNVTAKQERFGPQIASGRAPRTAIGYLGAKEVVLVTVDGRHQQSVGMTLHELARYMKGIGVMDAINLDGGGSTTLVVGGRTMNRPSGGYERPVNNALLLNVKGR